MAGEIDGALPPGLGAKLGIVPVRRLGGRCNHHWLIQADGETRVLRRWAEQPSGSIEYERTLLANLHSIGWPVSPFEPSVRYEGQEWSLGLFRPGSPRSPEGPEERRSRGRRLAEFHAAAASLSPLPQRPGWRGWQEILRDQGLDSLLSESEKARPEEIRIVRWDLDRARRHVEAAGPLRTPTLPIHGDFANWNLLFTEGCLTGLIDFELARNEHRIADFALAWRGRYDEVIEGYEEVSPLGDDERAALTSCWWATLIEGACRDLREGRFDGGWTVAKLLLRSPAMGRESEEYPGR